MYLVEIETGREQLYQSVEALAAAIRGGVVGPDSRIFHRASSSWISITVHPEYRKVMSGGPENPLPPLPRTQWTFFGTQQPERQVIEAGGQVPPPPAQAETSSAPRGLRALFGRGRRSSPSDAAEPSKS